MWQLTVCALILMSSLVLLVLLLIHRQTQIMVAAVKEIGLTQRQVVEQLIRPLVTNEPVQQYEVPEQTEMLSEPAWAKDWNP